MPLFTLIANLINKTIAPYFFMNIYCHFFIFMKLNRCVIVEGAITKKNEYYLSKFIQLWLAAGENLKGDIGLFDLKS